jgi:hypothetical protein
MATLVLDSTTKTIKAVMSGAAATSNPEFVVSWADSTSSSLTEGSTDGALNGTTPVTLVAAPASSTRRVIKSISIQNKDSASVTLTITYDNNGTARQLAKVTLAQNDTWTTDGVYDTNGNLKTSASGSGTVTTVSVASANGFAGTVANATSTPAITLSTSITGVLKGNGTAISAATAGTDYLAPPSGTAILKANSGGALANASAGTDYVAPGGALGTPSSGTLSSCTVDGTNSVGFRTAPQTSGGASSYTLVLTDSGKHVIFTGGSTATLTVPTNASVAFPIGTTILVVNDNSGNLTISGAGVTFQLANGSTGNRTVATKGLATCLKTATDTWYVSGAGVT